MSSMPRPTLVIFLLIDIFRGMSERGALVYNLVFWIVVGVFVNRKVGVRNSFATYRIQDRSIIAVATQLLSTADVIFLWI